MEIKETCKWVEDDCGVWSSKCGNDFMFNDGSPSENGFKFCPYCGKPLEEVRYKGVKDV